MDIVQQTVADDMARYRNGFAMANQVQPPAASARLAALLRRRALGTAVIGPALTSMLAMLIAAVFAERPLVHIAWCLFALAPSGLTFLIAAGFFESTFWTVTWAVVILGMLSTATGGMVDAVLSPWGATACALALTPVCIYMVSAGCLFTEWLWNLAWMAQLVGLLPFIANSLMSDWPIHWQLALAILSIGPAQLLRAAALIQRGVGLRFPSSWGCSLCLFAILVTAWSTCLIVAAFRGGPASECRGFACLVGMAAMWQLWLRSVLAWRTTPMNEVDIDLPQNIFTNLVGAIKLALFCTFLASWCLDGSSLFTFACLARLLASTLVLFMGAHQVEGLQYITSLYVMPQASELAEALVEPLSANGHGLGRWVAMTALAQASTRGVFPASCGVGQPDAHTAGVMGEKPWGFQNYGMQMSLGKLNLPPLAAELFSPMPFISPSTSTFAGAFTAAGTPPNAAFPHMTMPAGTFAATNMHQNGATLPGSTAPLTAPSSNGIAPSMTPWSSTLPTSTFSAATHAAATFPAATNAWSSMNPATNSWNSGSLVSPAVVGQLQPNGQPLPLGATTRDFSFSQFASPSMAPSMTQMPGFASLTPSAPEIPGVASMTPSMTQMPGFASMTMPGVASLDPACGAAVAGDLRGPQFLTTAAQGSSMPCFLQPLVTVPPGGITNRSEDAVSASSGYPTVQAPFASGLYALYLRSGLEILRECTVRLLSLAEAPRRRGPAALMPDQLAARYSGIHDNRFYLEALHVRAVELLPLARVSAAGLSSWICMSLDLDLVGVVQREDSLRKVIYESCGMLLAFENVWCLSGTLGLSEGNLRVMQDAQGEVRRSLLRLLSAFEGKGLNLIKLPPRYSRLLNSLSSSESFDFAPMTSSKNLEERHEHQWFTELGSMSARLLITLPLRYRRFLNRLSSSEEPSS